MRKALLHAILAAVPLAMVPWAVDFDTAKAFLLSLGALGLLALALRRPGGGTGPARLDLRWSATSAAAAACWLALALASLRAADPFAAGTYLGLTLAALVALSAFENVLLEADEVPAFAATVAAVLGVASAYGLLQAVGVDFPFPWREGGRTDPVSTLGNRNWAAEFAAAALPLAALAAVRLRGAGRAAAAIAFLLGAGLVVVAKGRAAWLGAACAAAAGASTLLLGSPRAAARAAGLAVGAAALAAVAGAAAWLHARDGELPAALGRSDTAAIRVDLARGTARMIADHPLGVGAGGWAAAHPPYRTEREYRLSLFRDPGEAHCDPLQVAAEGGWAAGAVLLLLGLLLARAAARAARGADRGAAAALAASLAATAGASLASAPLRRPASLLLAAAAAGMLAALAGGRTLPLATAGMWAVRAVTLLAIAGTAWLGLRTAAEGPQAEGRAILREASPLPEERARAARALFEDAASLDPGAADALSRAGQIALLAAPGGTPESARADHEAARAAFEAVLRLRPRDPLALAHLASARARLGEDAAAEEAWRAALEVAPWHRDALQGLAGFLARRGRAGEALPLVERALGVDPRWPPALAGRVEALAALDRGAEASEAASDGIDRLLALDPPDGTGAEEVARRAAAASEVLAEMLSAKAVRLLGGADPPGGLAVAMGIAAGRPAPERLERLGRALAGAGRPAESTRFILEARFGAAEEALARGDREEAAAAALRATGMTLPTDLGRAVRVRAAGILVRAGRREAALGELGWAVSRGWADPAALESDPAFAPIRDDPAFRGLVERARREARRAER